MSPGISQALSQTAVGSNSQPLMYADSRWITSPYHALKYTVILENPK